MCLNKLVTKKQLKIRQDSLKSAMSIQDKPAETQTEPKTDEEPTALIAKRD